MSGDDPVQRVLDLLDEVSENLSVDSYVSMLEELEDEIKTRLEAAREDAQEEED